MAGKKAEAEKKEREEAVGKEKEDGKEEVKEYTGGREGGKRGREG